MKSTNFWQSYSKNKKVDFLGHSVVEIYEHDALMLYSSIVDNFTCFIVN